MSKNTLIRKLNQPLSPSRVKFREKSGTRLQYLSGADVERSANTVFDYTWSSETLDILLLYERPYTRVKKTGETCDMIEVAYRARVRITVNINGTLVIRDGCGAGNGQSSALNPFDAHELAIKEAETDARKRALKTFGDQFGLSLYEKEINLAHEYADAQKFDLDFVELQRTIQSETNDQALKQLYRDYDGPFRDEVLAQIIIRRKELYRGKNDHS